MTNKPMQKKIIALIASVAAALVVLAGILLLWGTFSFSTPSLQQPGPPSLSVTDEKGDTWVLEPKGPRVSGFKDGEVKPGAPLLIKTDVQISGRDASIGLILQGRAGETYIPGVQKNGRRLSEPGLKIVDEAGKTLAVGKFKYG
jgi:hypothetical protein